MQRALGRTLAVTCACLAFALAAAAPAFGAPRPALAARAQLALRSPLSRLGATALTSPLPTGEGLPPGFVVKDLPMGGSFTGKVAGMDANSGLTGVHIIQVPMYAGMKMDFQLYGSGGQDWEMDLYQYDLNEDEPVAYTYTGYPLSMSYTADVIPDPYDPTADPAPLGWYDLYIFPPANGGTYTLKYTMTDPPVTMPIERIAGANRYETSVQTARSAFATANTVVVATGKNYADALAASSLCGSYDAPLLLTDPVKLPDAVQQAVTDYAPERIFVIGTPTSVSQAVADALQAAAPSAEVTRVAGIDRYETAALIASRVQEHELAEHRTPATAAFIASGKNFPDALAVSPLAFSQRMPILLTRPSSLPTATHDALASLGIGSTYVIGGAPTITDGVVAALAPAGVTRVAGDDRCATAAKAAALGVANHWADWSYVAVATGWNYPDALGGGVAAGKKGGLMLLSKGLYMGEEPYMSLDTNAASLLDVTLLGSPTTLGGAVMGDMNDIWSNVGFL